MPRFVITEIITSCRIKLKGMMIMEAVVNIIALVMALVGVVMVYDARLITRKLFGFGDQNQAAWGLKILGFIIALIGALIIYF